MFCDLDHGQEATEHLKIFIGNQYVYSDKPVFSALWDSYNACQFVEDEGETFYQVVSIFTD
jgi:hypothetical protein